MKRFKLFGVILALVFFSLSPAFAQQPTQKMRTELVKLKYLEANQTPDSFEALFQQGRSGQLCP